MGLITELWDPKLVTGSPWAVVSPSVEWRENRYLPGLLQRRTVTDRSLGCAGDSPERKCGPARDNTGLGLAAPWAFPGSTFPSVKWASGNLRYPTGDAVIHPRTVALQSGERQACRWGLDLEELLFQSAEGSPPPAKTAVGEGDKDRPLHTFTSHAVLGTYTPTPARLKPRGLRSVGEAGVGAAEPWGPTPPV